MKKKILALCLVVVLAVTAVTGATLAYFTDTDAAKNVMTTGNVKIVQNEQERGTDGKLTDYVDDNKLYPYTGSVDANGVANEYTEKVTVDKERDTFSQKDNAIDKIVTVKNDGSEECYVRTLFAWELVNVDGQMVNPLNNYIIPLSVKDAKGIGMPVCETSAGVIRTVTINEKQYCIAQYDYPVILKAGETTSPSLLSFYVNAKIDNELADMIGGDNEYNILVLSQAVQTAGFKSGDEYKLAEAEAAFSAAFGGIDYSSANVVDDTTLAGWFKDIA